LKEISAFWRPLGISQMPKKIRSGEMTKDEKGSSEKP